ncbi:MAG: acyltransferase [Rhodobacteraceae bacterium]|nr:acyltransferase [Paracoccaceae bacterium]
MTQAPVAGRIAGFDGLRGFAACIVVVFHYLAMLHPQWVADYATAPPLLVDTPLAVFWNGPFAVAVFFVLSGFVMAAAAERRHRHLIENLLIRYLRLAVPVLASVMLAYLWLSLFPTAARELAATFDAPSLWLSYTVQAPLPGLFDALHDGLLGSFITGSSAFNNVLWAMQIELVGSAFLFGVYWLGGFRGWLRFVALAGFAALALLAMRDAYLCFVTGALIYEAHKAGLLARLSPAIGVAALLGGMVLGAPGQGFAERWGLEFLPQRLQPGNVWGLMPVVAASLILLGVYLLATARRFFETAPLQWLGRISFALYLVHVPLLYSLVAWQHVHLTLPELPVMLAYLALALGLAHIFTLLFDEPTLRAIARIRKRTAALRASAPSLPAAGIRSNGGRSFWGFVVLATGALMLSALMNGGAALYYDSVVYLHPPEGFLRLIGLLPEIPQTGAGVEGALPATPAAEGPRLVHSGRSMFYQIVAAGALEFGRLWPLIALHAALVAYPAALLMQRVVGHAPRWGFVLGMAALGLLTPLGLSISVAMPDILVGVLALVIAALMAGWSALSWAERTALFMIAVFAMVSHASHLLLGLALPLVLLALPLPKAALLRSAALIWLAAFAAVGLESAQKTLQQRSGDVVLLTRPHLTAHMVDHGPGVDYLRAACPEAGFEMCNHLDHLPVEWREFLFGGRTPETRFLVDAPLAAQIAISKEQFALTAAIIAHDPVAVMDFAARAALRQLLRFDPAGVQIPSDDLPDWLEAHPGWMTAQVEAAPLRSTGSLLGALHASTAALALLGLAALGWAWRCPKALRGQETLLVAVTALLLAVLINAAICGILASPYDRFQARIIWLIPLAALAVLATRRWPGLAGGTPGRVAELPERNFQ